jgi:phenylalanyl-tRNA synthetase alpha chain
MPITITDDQLARALALRDLSDPASGPHAMQLVLDAIADALAGAWRCRVQTHRASPVVTVEENYELLGYEADAPTREARYTRYLDERRLLRSHTSAMIPSALRSVAAEAGCHDLVVACPGLVYRRDVVDRLHVGEPHQLDLWRVRRGQPLGGDDLEQMVGLVVSAVLPGAMHRSIPAIHPYTRDGREVEVRIGDSWVELLECGLAGDHVLAAAGLDPSHWSGLALGIGLDRALMLRKGIGDIRLLRSDDPRVAGQMLTLDPYREVSSMPPANRDISIAIAEEVTAEEIGDGIRGSLPAEILDAVEEVALVSETPASELPEPAIARIGLQPGQKNVLLRLVLRHPTQTLTAEQANRIRDRIYAAVHRGTASQWAAPRDG